MSNDLEVRVVENKGRRKVRQMPLKFELSPFKRHATTRRTKRIESSAHRKLMRRYYSKGLRPRTSTGRFLKGRTGAAGWATVTRRSGESIPISARYSGRIARHRRKSIRRIGARPLMYRVQGMKSEILLLLEAAVGAVLAVYAYDYISNYIKDKTGATDKKAIMAEIGTSGFLVGLIAYVRNISKRKGLNPHVNALLLGAGVGVASRGLMVIFDIGKATLQKTSGANDILSGRYPSRMMLPDAGVDLNPQALGNYWRLPDTFAGIK